MTPPGADPGIVQLIGQAIDRLRGEYDLALMAAGGDEAMVTLYLPGEWTILARRVCELIVTEVMRRERDRAAAVLDGGPAACTGCGLSLWRVHVSPGTGLRRTECARCGMACHV